MITIHKEWVKSILDGKKSIELRTRIPKELQHNDVILVAQSETHNRVALAMMVHSIIKLHPDEMFDKYWREIQVNNLAYKDYTKDREWVYGIKIYNVVKLRKELHTDDFGINKAPQWFRKVNLEIKK